MLSTLELPWDGASRMLRPYDFCKKSLYLFLTFLFFFCRDVMAEEKVVFLAGDGVDAFTVLLSYETNKLAREERHHSLGDLKVVIHDGTDFREISIRWYDYLLDCIVPFHTVYCAGGNVLSNLTKPGFSRSWQRMIWFSKLNRYQLKTKPEIIEIAKTRGWEIYSLNPKEVNIASRMKEEIQRSVCARVSKMSTSERSLRILASVMILVLVAMFRTKLTGFWRFALIFLSVLLLLTAISGHGISDLFLKGVTC